MYVTRPIPKKPKCSEEVSKSINNKINKMWEELGKERLTPAREAIKWAFLSCQSTRRDTFLTSQIQKLDELVKIASVEDKNYSPSELYRNKSITDNAIDILAERAQMGHFGKPLVYKAREKLLELIKNSNNLLSVKIRSIEKLLSLKSEKLEIPVTEDVFEKEVFDLIGTDAIPYDTPVIAHFSQNGKIDNLCTRVDYRKLDVKYVTNTPLELGEVCGYDLGTAYEVYGSARKNPMNDKYFFNFGSKAIKFQKKGDKSLIIKYVSSKSN